MVSYKKVSVSHIVYFYIILTLAYRIIPFERENIITEIFGKVILSFRILLIIYEIKLLLSRTLLLNRAIKLFTITVLVVLQYQNVGEWILFDIFFILICFNEVINYKKVYSIVFRLTLVFSIVIVCLNFLGIRISEYIFYNAYGEVRYSFGFTHPNEFGGIVLFLIIFYILNKVENVYLWKEILFILFSGVFVYIFPKSITSSILIMMIALTMIIGKFKILRFFEKFIKYKVLFFGGLLSLIGVMIFLIYAIAFRGYGREFVAKVSGTFYTRFFYGQKAYNQYGFSWFGQRINMVNEKTIAMGGANLEYFNLDSAFFYLPIVLGIIPTIYYLMWYFKSLFLTIKFRYYKLLLILILMFFYAISETVFLNYSLYLFLGALGYADKKKNYQVYEKNNL